MLELTEEEVKMRAEAAQQQHMATNELLTQVHTLGGDAQTRCAAGGQPGAVNKHGKPLKLLSAKLPCSIVLPWFVLSIEMSSP
jgi:hypothetical protein